MYNYCVMCHNPLSLSLSSVNLVYTSFFFCAHFYILCKFSNSSAFTDNSGFRKLPYSHLSISLSRNVLTPSHCTMLSDDILHLSIQYCFMEIYMKSQFIIIIIIIIIYCSCLFLLFAFVLYNMSFFRLIITVDGAILKSNDVMGYGGAC